jgi:anti-sigma factor ChrR (cupin superfamily)
MHPNDSALHDYVDGTIGTQGRSSVEQHLSTCPSCRQVVEDLREIACAIGTLELREPTARVWGRIERAIALERDAHRSGENVAPGLQPSDDGRGPVTAGHHRRMGKTTWLALAAALLLVTMVGLRFMPGRGQAGTPPTTGETTSAGDAAQAIESELRLAETHYEKAIKGLEQIASSDQGALDPKTAATLQKNLAVIDQAISESRAAVRAEPTNEPAQQSLIENFKSKMGLLQDTVALINEMRKGNEAGAARIVSGLKQKG